MALYYAFAPLSRRIMPFNTLVDDVLPPQEAEAIAAEAVRLLAERGPLVLNAVDEGIYCLDTAAAPPS
ncbi:hypothetical protein BH11GEM1_BH11GEM1_08480 [soil metagenome]